jgi:HEAT repeat protein
MQIADIAREILDGKDFEANVRRLKPVRREAIGYFLSVLAGTSRYRPARGVHPFDSADAALGAISELGKDDLDYLLELIAHALDSRHTEPAFSLTWVLAHLRAREALDVLMCAVTHKDQYIRWAACTGLQQLRAKRARPLLNRAAADRSSLVRHCAVQALASLGNETSILVLEKRLDDRYPGIRSAAAEAIEAIKRRRPPDSRMQRR